MSETLHSSTTSAFRRWMFTHSGCKKFALFALVLCISYYILETINHRAQMADFRVYYDAANAFLDNTQLYGKAFGVSSGFYKYSPFATLPFVPLAILPYTVASIVYYLVISFSIIWFALRIFYFLTIENTFIESSKKSFAVVMLLSLIFMADHLERELHLGNVNLFLLIGAFIIYLKTKDKKPIQAGLLLGVLLLFKPHFLILLPYFVWKMEWKILMYTCLSVVLGLFFPAIFKGFDFNLELLRQWLQAMQDHNVHLYESPNTIYGIVNHFVFNDGEGSWLVYAFLGLVALLFMALMIINQRRSKNNSPQFIEYFVLIALIPNLAHTDTEHFMWTWPLIAFVVSIIVNEELSNKWIYIGLMILAFIPYTVNSPDIVGRELRFLFDEGGLLGAANLIIVCVAVMLWLRPMHISKAAFKT